MRNYEESSVHDMDDEDDDDDPEGDDALESHRRPQTVLSPRRGAALPRLFSFWKFEEEKEEEEDDRDVEAAEVRFSHSNTETLHCLFCMSHRYFLRIELIGAIQPEGSANRAD